MLFRRNMRSRAASGAPCGLQRAARRSPVKLPLLLMVDQEGGRVTRVPGGPSRGAAGVGSTGAALADGRRAGSALRAGDSNVDLAPVADVCRRGSALDRERRCYGRDARTVVARGRVRARAAPAGVAPGR